GAVARGGIYVHTGDAVDFRGERGIAAGRALHRDALRAAGREPGTGDTTPKSAHRIAWFVAAAGRNGRPGVNLDSNQTVCALAFARIPAVGVALKDALSPRNFVDCAGSTIARPGQKTARAGPLPGGEYRPVRDVPHAKKREGRTGKRQMDEGRDTRYSAA